MTGIGGIFLRSHNPQRLAEWYRQQLGIQVDGLVAVWEWLPPKEEGRKGATLWAALSSDDREWGPRQPTAMVNYRVSDLESLLDLLRRNGVKVETEIKISRYGRFGWAIDPDGNRIELWEPPRRGYRSPEPHMPMA